MRAFAMFSLSYSVVVFSCFIILLRTTATEAGWRTSILNSVYSALGYETCEPPNVHRHNSVVKRLKTSLKEDLFGQHLATDIVVTALKAHIEDPNPSKALVLSLHGWAGSGKTFTSQHIMDAMYNKGSNSSFVRFFMSSYHFPDPFKTMEYQDLIRRNIREVVYHCPRALFIFDEVDKLPSGVLDALVPFTSNYPGETLDGLDFKKSVYVFMSNLGANDITKITRTHWDEGKNRVKLNFKDFEQTLSNEAFNSKGSGLYKSRLIDKILVDYFVPFLPLERQHVLSCVKVEAKRYGMQNDVVDEEAEKIADMMTFWPANLKLYSTSGCKKVDLFVKYRMAELNLLKNETGDDDSEDDEDRESKTEL